MFDDNLEERYLLSIDRIAEINKQITTGEIKLPGNFSLYFRKMADFILDMEKLSRKLKKIEWNKEELSKLQSDNYDLYRDILPDNYDESYANPAFAVKELGTEHGRLLSFLYVELRNMIVYVYEQRLFDITILCELFLEIFCMFSENEDDEIPDSEAIREAIYWYVSDYSDITMEERVAEQLDINKNFAFNIIMNSDLSDVRYLYKFGEYITDNELRTAKYLNSLSDWTIDKMASTFTGGFKKGFELGNKDLSKKNIVAIRYCLGFERVVKREIEMFEQMGLKTVLYRSATHTINKKMNIRVGYYGAVPNRQLEYDHRFDDAIYLNNDFVERKLGALKCAYEKYKSEAAHFAGPAVMEIFGENPFEPVNKEENYSLDAKQQKLSVKYSNEAGRIVNDYIPGEERSFTIIAYPVPEIGKDFEKIFKETVKINTLDYEVYKKVQQTIIDALDGSSYVRVIGNNGNNTDIKVAIHKLENPEKQTAFENCVADVNIPLGEVFTSPVLEGTNGRVCVSKVYLNDFCFNDFFMEFKDGYVVDYGCSNFEDEKKSKELIKQNVLYSHDTLPMGEFAIGTNTTAYVMANKYDIVYKLPILIVEKMGPHFAVGDTCYSWAEDTAVFNPDGKEIIARDNSASLNRKTDISKAYFNCHTDVTIPYAEIGEITAIKPDGKEITIIKDGRFVLDGVEMLNEAFNPDEDEF